MTAGQVKAPLDNKTYDTTEVTVASAVVERSNVVIAGQNAADIAPVSTAAPAGTEAGLYVRVVSQPAGSGGGGPVTIADNANVVEGALADAAITTNATGTISGKLRGLVAILADVWDSVNHRLNVALPAATVTTLTPPAAITGFALEAGHLATIDSHTPALGQALAAASVPVILPAATVTTLTPPAAITGFALEAGHLATIDSHTTTPTAKGTQGANFAPVQEAKDSGRVNIMWTAEFSPGATAEALLTVTESRDGAATTTFTSKVVTSGKRLRITSITLFVENTLGASLQRSYLRLRFNAAGAVTTASPQQHILAAQAAGTVKSISPVAFEDFPDGVEFLGDGTKQIGFTIAAPDWVSATSTLKVYMAAFGYEY